jgi:hypothetical protein
MGRQTKATCFTGIQIEYLHLKKLYCKEGKLKEEKIKDDFGLIYEIEDFVYELLQQKLPTIICRAVINDNPAECTFAFGIDAKTLTHDFWGYDTEIDDTCSLDLANFQLSEADLDQLKALCSIIGVSIDQYKMQVFLHHKAD